MRPPLVTSILVGVGTMFAHRYPEWRGIIEPLIYAILGYLISDTRSVVNGTKKSEVGANE